MVGFRAAQLSLLPQGWGSIMYCAALAAHCAHVFSTTARDVIAPGSGTSIEHDSMAGKSIQNLIKYFSVVQMFHPVREHFFDNLHAIEFSHQPPRFLFRNPSMLSVAAFK